MYAGIVKRATPNAPAIAPRANPRANTNIVNGIIRKTFLIMQQHLDP